MECITRGPRDIIPFFNASSGQLNCRALDLSTSWRRCNISTRISSRVLGSSQKCAFSNWSISIQNYFLYAASELSALWIMFITFGATCRHGYHSFLLAIRTSHDLWGLNYSTVTFSSICPFLCSTSNLMDRELPYPFRAILLVRFSCFYRSTHFHRPCCLQGCPWLCRIRTAEGDYQ